MSIHLLADQGDKSGVAQCIAGRANVNEADTTGQKPLHYAAAKGFAEIVALLLQHEADPNSKSDRGTTPLHEAAKSGKLETVVLLLDSKADPLSLDNELKSPLHYAIAGGHAKVVSKLLEYGADINTAAKDGTTALHLAAAKGNLPLLRLLIEKGAKLDARDIRGNTALASVPLADRPALEVPASPKKLLANIKSLWTSANAKPQGYDTDEDGNEKWFSDVTFVVDGQQIHAHRNIIAVRCARLGKMFKNPNQQDKVEIRDVSAPTFQAVLEWIYSEDVAAIRASDPDVSFILSLLSAADRFGLKDLKVLCEALAMRNINTANIAALWNDLRKCTQASPDLHAYNAHLLARNWNVLASSKFVQDMGTTDIVDLCNILTIGEVKEEPIQQEPVVHKQSHRAHSPKRRTPHIVHTPQPETPVRTQPDRAAHRHATPVAAPPVADPEPPPVISQNLPPELNSLQIGNNNFWANSACKMEGKNLKNVKNIHQYVKKHKNAWPFAEPVDPIKLGIPNYRDIIKEPMDLGTIQTNLDRDVYTTVNQYAQHMRLVFVNALTFNQPGYDIYKMAEGLLKVFNQKFEQTSWERTSANGESYSESTPVSNPSTPTAQPAKQKRKSGTYTPSAPASRAGNGHPSPSRSPSPPPPSPPPVKREHVTPREKAPPPPAPKEEEDMSYEDKRDLGSKMHRLEPHQLSHVIQILGAKTQSDDDIEIDMNDVPIDKLRLLQKYVNSCLEPEKKKRRHKGEDEEDVEIVDQEPEVGWDRKEHKNKKSKKHGRDDDD